MKNTASKVLAATAVLIFGAFGFSPVAMRAQAPPPPPGQSQPQSQAQPDGQPQSDADHGVARLSFIRGDVSIQRGDDPSDSTAATLNTPFVTGDKISTGAASRAELQLDFANVLRLDEQAQASVATLTGNRIQVQLAQGLATFSQLNGSEADAEIDTPNVSVHPMGPGQYRVQVTPAGDTFVVVREGRAEVSTPQGSTSVNRGELITIRGAGSDAAYQTSNAAPPDAWDDWNRDRDNVIVNAEGARRTNRYYTGAGDLDSNGVWSEVPDYGQVWVPRVAAGWAPYRAGRWVWEPYYGWTWVSAEPWGWAPYHYGRWFLYSGSWAWWPGPVFRPYRPIWAPAYVSFFGFGGGVGVGVGFGFGLGFGSIGWLPIGPADYFHPWYGGFRGGFSAVGIGGLYGVHEGFAPLRAGGFSTLRDVAVNDRLRAGISSVGADRFGRGAVEARTVSAADLRSGRAMTGSMPVNPSRESLRVSDRSASPGAFSRANSARFSSGGTAASRPSQGFSAQGNSGGWQRFGSSSGGAQANRPQSGESFNRSAGTGSYRPSSPSSSYREPLNLNRPIVRERSSGGSTNGNASSGYRPPSGYNASPSYRGAPSQSAPSYRSAPNSGGSSTGRGPAPSYRGGSGSSGGGSRGGSSGRSSGSRSSGGGGHHR